ncbi:MAG: TrkA family potassium uptake protein [Erysipelotrichaceae bacterium]|nr:TrkA family potassium uptake protein [Erysipelotrichaceae bacterium]MBR5049346.1 TrkA family potassium uptake protein [Erysipelotrichaceae bacterium]
MKIVIADGSHQADYIIGMYNNRENELIVINSDSQVAKYLSAKNGISVLNGKPTKESDLFDAGIDDADLFIALSENDVDNYVACKTAKKLFNVRKCIATVINPKNVDLFKQLGVDSVISSTYLLGEQIKNTSHIENLINTLSLEDNKINILEIMVREEYDVCGKTLKEIKVSDTASVSSVIRNERALIPNGDTMLEAGDKVLLVTTKEHYNEVAKIFQRKKI